LLYYELYQPDPEWTIIFIHGTPGDSAAFREQLVHPFPHANLIVFDRPGFGGSKPALRHPSLEDQANAISALLPTNKNQRVILVGHSYGGPIALQAALKFTNQVAGVLLIGGSIDPGQEKIYTIQRIGNWPVLSWLLPRDLRQCNRELLTLKGDLIKLKPRIATLTVPVIMLHGKKDDLVPVENTDYLRNQLAAAGYNHFIPWEHPDAVEAALRKLTDRLSSVAPKP
jgi:pimeloyl-ACP methyl ester carboxylesterase